MFPQLYHIHHNAHTEDLPFWLKLAQQQGGPVLELGCGTGRVLIPLIQAIQFSV
jgi:ubiquinone/menaquinone biosynthesis C-methylase UbiE